MDGCDGLARDSSIREDGRISEIEGALVGPAESRTETSGAEGVLAGPMGCIGAVGVVVEQPKGAFGAVG